MGDCDVIAVTQRQDVMGREGRKVFDMRPPVKSKSVTGFDYSIFTFGCVRVDDTSVDVYPGEVQHASSYFNSAKTTVGVSGGSLASPRYICGLYVRGSSLTILPDALATKPVSNDTNFYFWISSWYHTSEGTLTLLRINHNNAIIIPNLWAI